MAFANITVTVDLPTPPLPDITVIIFLCGYLDSIEFHMFHCSYHIFLEKDNLHMTYTIPPFVFLFFENNDHIHLLNADLEYAYKSALFEYLNVPITPARF